MTKNEVMDALKELHISAQRSGPASTAKALLFAIDAVRDQMKSEVPLTLEELRQMDGEPVWVEHYNGGEWVTVHWNYVDCIATAYNACLRMSEYGNSWLAYRRKQEGPADG